MSSHLLCPSCGEMLREEHQHFRCDSCGLIEPCCEGGPGPGVHAVESDATIAMRIRRIQEDLCAECVESEPDAWPEGLCQDCQQVYDREQT